MAQRENCFVPYCKNNSENNPEKRFFSVPKENKKEWCESVGQTKILKRALHVCEDHLNLKEDMENYMYWKLMKVRPKLKARVPAGLRQIFDNKQNMPEPELPEYTHQKFIDNMVQCEPYLCHKYTQIPPLKMCDRAVSCNILKTPYKRSTYTLQQMQIQETIPEDPSEKGSTTTDLSEFEYNPSTTSESVTTSPNQKNLRPLVLKVIAEKPYSYLGLPKQFYFLINYIEKKSAIKTTALNIIITLYKIKQNDTFNKICDLFEISIASIWRLFFATLNILTDFFKQNIFHPPPRRIKHNLPTPFKPDKKYSNIQAIIDCLEIEIEKPSNPIEQSLSWSTYKNCNTIKYLISSTPDGFVNFVSEGFGGRKSDVAILEESGFLDILAPGAVILADRGFKHCDPILSARGFKLVRPASVYKDKKLSEEEVIETKKIASLRIHIERVIRRLRQFKMLKPHSTVNNKLICYLDNCIIIACGLINLQTPIVKRY